MNALRNEKDLAAENRDIRKTMGCIDAMAGEALQEIQSIARLCLAWLERPEAYNHSDVIAGALITIRDEGYDIEHAINSEAGRFGCDYVDEASRHRFAAYLAACDDRKRGDANGLR